MKRSIIILLLAALIVGCQQSNETIKIGWIGPLTGPSAVLGIDSVVAAELAVQEINEKGGILGKQVELVVEDDQYITSKTATAYQKLVNTDKVSAVFMITYGGVLALGKQSQIDGIILIDPLDCDHPMAALGENVFCIAPLTEEKARVVAQFALDSGADKAGVLYFDGDPFMPLVAEFFEKDFKVGEKTVIAESYALGVRDFKTSLLKMIEAEVDTIGLFGYDELGLASKQARELGFNGTFLATATATSPGWQNAAEGAAEGTFLGFREAPNSPKQADFMERFTTLQGRRPIIEVVTDTTYDGMYILAQAIERANTVEPSEVSKALLATQEFSGVTGVISMKKDGAAPVSWNIYRLENKKPVPI